MRGAVEGRHGQGIGQKLTGVQRLNSSLRVDRYIGPVTGRIDGQVAVHTVDGLALEAGLARVGIGNRQNSADGQVTADHADILGHAAGIGATDRGRLANVRYRDVDGLRVAATDTVRRGHDDLVDIVRVGIGRGFVVRRGKEAQHAADRIDAEQHRVESAADRVADRVAIGIGGVDIGNRAGVFRDRRIQDTDTAIRSDDRVIVRPHVDLVRGHEHHRGRAVEAVGAGGDEGIDIGAGHRIETDDVIVALVGHIQVAVRRKCEAGGPVEITARSEDIDEGAGAAVVTVYRIGTVARSDVEIAVRAEGHLLGKAEAAAARGNEFVDEGAGHTIETHHVILVPAVDVQVTIGAEQQAVGFGQGGVGREHVDIGAGAAVEAQHPVVVIVRDIQVTVRSEGETQRQVESAAARSDEFVDEIPVDIVTQHVIGTFARNVDIAVRAEHRVTRIQQPVGGAESE